ncbi:MAG: D-cysteine desulfhydrase family protein [Chloroflexi bacterium]|nr:MAG: D-cysteine desulfhydrase family protein [Chloroflexota bacterium]
MNTLTHHLPRTSLAYLPTPLEPMDSLRKHLGDKCPHLLIKRDDLTGLATGGNKTRKLEFLLGDALQQNTDIIITTGGAQSNHCRQTAAACAKLGLPCVLVLSGEAPSDAAWHGNLLLDVLFNAKIRWIGARDRAEACAEVADEWRAQGHTPYIIPTGGSIPRGASGYVAAVEELAAQLDAMNASVDRIVFASGSGGTHAGILVGVKALGMNTRVEAVALEDLTGFTNNLSRQTAAFLGFDMAFDDDDFVFHNVYESHPYGVITDVEREAIRLLANTEGILADPVYTARAFAALVDHIKRGIYAHDETVLFWHTGGTAGLFARADELMSYLFTYP